MDIKVSVIKNYYQLNQKKIQNLIRLLDAMRVLILVKDLVIIRMIF